MVVSYFTVFEVIRAILPVVKDQDRPRTREHWIQRVTFAAETNAACSRRSADTHTDGRRASQYLLRSLSGGEGNKTTEFETKTKTKTALFNTKTGITTFRDPCNPKKFAF